jgi:glycosyltransferase involved in cell wall biosynthesis
VTGGISIVVCTRDRPDSLAATLATLSPVVGTHDEVVVVDSASTGDRTRTVAVAAGFGVVRASRPGLSHARNLGIAASTRSIVAFTDDDCRVGPAWREAVEAAFLDPAIGLVTGPVAALAHDGRSMTVSTLERSSHQRYSAPTRPAEIGHGANMAFRRVALDAAGPFDEALGAGARFRAADDWDMFWRVLREGWSASYTADAVIHHEQWRSRRQAIQTRYGYSIGAAAFCVKASRLGDPMGRRVLVDRLRHEGVHTAVRGVRQRKATLAAIGAANVVGSLTGAWRARGQTLDGTCYASAYPG